MKNWHYKIFFSTVFSFLFMVLHAQQAVNYVVEIVELEMSGSGSCNDGQGNEEEPTWLIWTNDNVNSTWDGGYCHTDDADFTSSSTPAHVPQPNKVVS